MSAQRGGASPAPPSSFRTTDSTRTTDHRVSLDYRSDIRADLQAPDSIELPDRAAGNGKLMVDKLTAVPRKRVGTLVGTLSPEELKALNRSVFVFLGLAETETTQD